MRLAAYAGTSAVVAAGALLKAFNQRPNFYSATVYLSQSNACILILTNLALVVAISFIYGLQRLLYGPLRPIEIEQLSEKAWYAVLDTLLAIPSLKDDVGGWLLATFVLLLAGKVWGWIAEGRVDILEQQPPQNPRLFHLRLSASLLVSIAFSAGMLRYCLRNVLEDPRPGMMVIFTFEFAILTIFSLFTFSRYLLALMEARVVQLQTKAKIEERKAEIREERERIQREAGEGETPRLPSEDDVDDNEIDVPGWEEKRRWLFALELATDFIKIVVYTVFFTISLTFMGLPMHIMRDIYLTFSSFTKKLQDYSNYRKATQDMNNRYPDATAEELGNENTCIVCREVMVPWEQEPPQQGAAPARRRTINEGLRAKKLPCGHILHLRCLKAWLERQQACPTCRRSVVQPATAAATNAAGNAGQAAPAPGGDQAQGQAPGANLANGARQQRRNRMRWLNMGPVRIGFYNGPAGQVQEALRQQQGEPTAAAGLRAPTSSRSTSDLIRTVEMRLLEQANNLGIEQAQLANLRAMEAEMTRLRSQISNTSGTQQQPQVQGSRLFPFTQGFPQPMGQPPQAFQPTAGQEALGPGHPDLPEGVTLPEGWSLLPLQRAGGQMPVNNVIPPMMPPFGMGFPPQMMQNLPLNPQAQGLTATFPPPGSQQNATPTQQGQQQRGAPQRPSVEQRQQSTGAPDPAQPAETNVDQSTSTAPSEIVQTELDSGPSAQVSSLPQAPSVVPEPSQTRPPWTNGGWNFDSSASQHQSSGGLQAADSASAEQSSTNEAGGADANQQTSDVNGGNQIEKSNSPEGKGKARAVEVEDVPDSEAYGEN